MKKRREEERLRQREARRNEFNRHRNLDLKELQVGLEDHLINFSIFPSMHPSIHRSLCIFPCFHLSFT